MAFQKGSLQSIGSAGGFGVFGYDTTDPLADLLAKGYFDGSTLQAGDRLMVCSRPTGAPLQVADLAVTKIVDGAPRVTVMRRAAEEPERPETEG